MSNTTTVRKSKSKYQVYEKFVGEFSIDRETSSRAEWKRILKPIKGVQLIDSHSPYVYHSGLKIVCLSKDVLKKVIETLQDWNIDWVEARDFEKMVGFK